MSIDYGVGDPVVCVDDRPNLNGYPLGITKGKIYKVTEIRDLAPTGIQSPLGFSTIGVFVNAGNLHSRSSGAHPDRFKKLRKANVDIFKLANPSPIPVPTREPDYV